MSEFDGNKRVIFDSEPLFVKDNEKLDKVLKSLGLAVSPCVGSDIIMLSRETELLKLCDDLYGVWSYLAEHNLITWSK